MGSDKYVKLNILTNGVDQAKRELSVLKDDADDLTRKRIIPISANDDDAKARLSDLKLKIADVTDKSHDINIDAKDDRAKAKLIDLQLRLERLDRYTASPKITLQGADRTEARLLGISAAMDDIKRKNDELNSGGGFFSKLFGGGKGSEGNSAEGAAGDSGVLTNPYVLTGLIGTGAAVLPSLVGLGTGLGIGGLGAYGAYEKNAKPFDNLGTLIQSELYGALSSQIMTAGQRSGNRVSGGASGVAGTSFMSGIVDVLKQLGSEVRSVGPELGGMFRASLPFLQQFAVLLGQSAKILIPSFTQVMKEMVSSGALSSMMQGLVEIVRALAQFINAMGPALKPSAEVFSGLMRVLGTAVDGLGHLISFFSQNVAVDFATLGTIVRIFAGLFTGNWKAIQNAADDLRHYLATELDAMGNDLGSFQHVISHIFDDIRHGVSTAWSGMWHDIYGTLKEGVSQDVNFVKVNLWDALTNDFDQLRHSIASIWDALWRDSKSAAESGVRGIASAVHGIINAFESPIRFVVDDVWDKLAGIWNSIQGVVHVGFKLPVVHMATGGVVPGAGDRDSVPALLTPGERVLSKSQVAMAGGHGMLDALFGRGSGGPFAFGGGGIIGDIGGFLSGIGHDIMGWISKPLSFIESHVFGAATGLLSHLGNSGLATMLKTMIGDVVKSLSGSLHQQGANTSPFTGAYGPGVAQWRPDVLRVLSMLGLPASDAGTVLTQMMTESGGNPNAINLTDSNAAAGDPSRGLMQTIMPTFEAYRSPLFPNNIYNPEANIYAGLNYAIHRYGNPGWLSVLGHGHGYQYGGLITEPIAGVGLKSGFRYSFGENGFEQVTPTNRRYGAGVGGDTYIISVETSAFDTDATATKIVQSIRSMKRHHGNQPTGIG